MGKPFDPIASGCLGAASFQAIGTTVSVLTTDPSAVGTAEMMLRHELAQLDQACSRFRDSELTQLHQREGRWVEVSPLLAELIEVSLDVARFTDGAVDPTVGSAMMSLGYDVDFDALDRDDPRPREAVVPAPGWQSIEFDASSKSVRIPTGVRLDLGSSSKAFAADRAARRIAAQLGCGTLVNLGGDIATSGSAPDDGWRVGIDFDSRTSTDYVALVVTLCGGGLASSGTKVRNWRRNGELLHHIVDPRTGDVARTPWALVTVASSTCLQANAASTASIVMGRQALNWLTRLRLAARLVDGAAGVTLVGGWPDEPIQG